MLNVSATQELAKKVTSLEAKNAALQAEISLLKGQAAQLTKLSAKFEALEKRVAASQAEATGDQTVALERKNFP